ncbi:uncharacterized protein LOC127807312 [Diospyros lotus]|uniref:uncharacterized protein LOC127807312 n=1 Tax=Diospyros lotus TaxID=55363 RepID=UPI0022524AEC|nr:uncharacterized protein LOC127807312 [Diospyros lotus]
MDSFYSSNFYHGCEDEYYVSTPYCTSNYDIVPFHDTVEYSVPDPSEPKFFEYDSTAYSDACDPFPTQSLINYSTYNPTEPKLIQYHNPAHYGYETQYVISYSQTTEPDDPDIDFVEYDPTPFRGGYDPVLTYGKPLPPSDEICYPRSLHVSNGHPSDGFSYGSIPSPYGKDDSDPRNTVKPREETEPTYPSTGDNGHLLGEEIPPEKPSDSGQGDQDQRDGYGSEGCDPPWPGYDYGSGNGYDHKEVAHQLPYGYGLEAMDLCESLFGYWPCLSRKKKYYGCQEFGSGGEVGQDHQWKNSAADYLFGSPYGYNYGGHYHYQQSS